MMEQTSTAAPVSETAVRLRVAAEAAAPRAKRAVVVVAASAVVAVAAAVVRVVIAHRVSALSLIR
jgi:hypothetical protein